MRVTHVETPKWVGSFKHELCGAIIELTSGDATHVRQFYSVPAGAPATSVVLDVCPHCQKYTPHLKRVSGQNTGAVVD